MVTLNSNFAKNPGAGLRETEPAGSVAPPFEGYWSTINNLCSLGRSAGAWFMDDDVQSNYGADEIIYCGRPDRSGFCGLDDASPKYCRCAAPLNQHDSETELYYVHNRTFSPPLGRWLQRDPIGYAGGVNLYGYVGGRATVRRDTSGLYPCGPCAAVAAAAANLLGAQSAYDQALQRIGQDEAAVRADAQALPALKNALKAAVAAERSARTEELLVFALLQSAIANAYAHPHNWGYEMDKIIVENKFKKARARFHADEARTRAAQANLAGDQAAMSAAQAALTADKAALAAANYWLANAEAQYINALAKCHR